MDTVYNKTINLYKKTIYGNISNKNNWISNNLSNKNLSDDERKVLPLLGLNFSVSQSCILKIDIGCSESHCALF